MAHPSSRACMLMCVLVCAHVRVHLVCVRVEGSYGPADASARAGKRADSHGQWSEVRAVLCESLCKCWCECACGKVCGLERAEQRRVVVWASGRGWAEDGMACAVFEDGGDPCSVTDTQSLMCRLKACVILINLF